MLIKNRFVEPFSKSRTVCTEERILEIVITRAAPAFHNRFMVMGCVFDINTVHETIETLTFQAFY